MTTTILNFNDITIVINEAEENKHKKYMNNAYVTYHRNNKAIKEWSELSKFEALCIDSLVNIFCEENQLIKWSY